MQALDVNELLDDAELQKLHEERIAKMKSEHERRAAMQRQGHGELQEITEGEFLEVVTKTDYVVCHFFHRDFERCKIMDKHLSILARRHFKTRFIKLSAPVRDRTHSAECTRAVCMCSWPLALHGRPASAPRWHAQLSALSV